MNLRWVVGVAAATEFSAFLATFRELPNNDAILLKPLQERVPESATAQCASDLNLDRICAYIERMPVEFQVLCVRDASLRPAEVRHTLAYTRWGIAHHEALA